MIFDYAQILPYAARALNAEDESITRLSRVAWLWIQLVDSDVPLRALKPFEAVRDPLIAELLAAEGRLLPRDLDESEGRTVARALIDLTLAELGGSLKNWSAACGVIFAVRLVT